MEENQRREEVRGDLMAMERNGGETVELEVGGTVGMVEAVLWAYR